MNRRLLKKSEIIGHISFVFMFIILEILIASIKGIDIWRRILYVIILSPSILVSLISLIRDYKLRKSLNENSPIKEKNQEIIKEKIVIDEEDEKFAVPNSHNKAIDNALGENIHIIAETDIYGNIKYKTKNNNLVDWLSAFIFCNMMILVMIISFFKNTINLMSLLTMLLLFVLFDILSFSRIRDIKKLKLKIKPFQILKFIFILTIMIIVFGVQFISFCDFDIDYEKVFIISCCLIMFIGIITFSYRIFLSIKAIKKRKIRD